MPNIKETHAKLVDCCRLLEECAFELPDLLSEFADSDRHSIGHALFNILEIRGLIYRSHPELKPLDWDRDADDSDFREWLENAITRAETLCAEGKLEEGLSVLQSFIELMKPPDHIRRETEQALERLREAYGA